MNERDDFHRLGALWREDGPAPLAPELVPDLVRAADRKRRRMRLLVGLELGCTVVATYVIARGIADPVRSVFTDERRVWNWLTLALVWLSQAVLLYQRRAEWRTPTATAVDLLALARQRARTAIRLVWLNLASLALFAAVTVPFALAEWSAGTRQAKLVLLGQATAVVLLLAVVALISYLRRQRRRLREVEALQAKLADEV